MNRRGFLGALLAAPVAAMAVPLALAKRGMVSGAASLGSISGAATLSTIGHAPAYLEPLVWPVDGVPFDVARKGYDMALADGDIAKAGEILPKFEYPDVEYGADVGDDFLSLPELEPYAAPKLEVVATGNLRDLYYADRLMAQRLT